MAITPKNEEKLQEFETALRVEGEKLDAFQVASVGRMLTTKPLKEALRVAIYMENLHQKDQDRDWDKMIPVDSLMKTLREQF